MNTQPCNPDTEQRLLSVIMIDAEHLRTAQDAGVTVDSFTEPRHRTLFSGIVKASATYGATDAYSVAQALDDNTRATGLELRNLDNLEGTSIRLRPYLREIRDLQQRRDLIAAGQRAVAAAASGGDADRELARLGAQIEAAKSSPDAAPPALDLTLDAQDYGTDLDASLRFAGRVRDTLRYVPGLGWLAWDKRRWARDGGEGRALELSKVSARAWTVEALRTEGDDARAAAMKKALTLEGASHIRAAVELACSDPQLATSAAALDTNPYLLNVSNGTLDLRTGTLKPHDRRDLLTKLAPVAFVTGATHPALDRLLSTLREHSTELPDFLSRVFGYTLTGEVSAEALILIQGDGGAGKTTLTEAIAGLLGDYATKLPFESFAQSKRGRGPGAASPDLVCLRGSRFAFAAEGDQSARLDAGLVKQLTGGEAMTARELYAAPITFLSTWKLFLVSNYDPRCDADDTGLWRRLIKIHFPAVPVAQRDPGIKRALTEDPAARSALLWWALQGCLDWQARGGGRAGLAVPGDVEAATQAYRTGQDTLTDWWKDLLGEGGELIPTSFTEHSKIRRHYDEWAESEGAMPLGAPRFKDGLLRLGLREHRTKQGRGWLGIRMSF